MSFEQDSNQTQWWSMLMRQMREFALLFLDREGRIQGWLPGAEQTFGYSASEIVGQPSHKLFTPEDIAAGIPEYELTVGAATRVAEDDRWMVRQDGARFWANGALMPLRSDKGDVIAFAKLLRDRTDVKTQIENLKSERDSLAKSIARKNAFIVTLAHELRNPLSALSLASAQLEAEMGPAEQGNLWSKAVRRQIDVMARMVTDLLDLARMETGKVQMRVEPLELGEVLNAAAEECRPLVRERQHELTIFRNPGSMWVQGDSGRLHQVFVNLIQNAAKYTPVGGNIWVKLTTEADEAAIKVQDNGIGISAELLPRIFDLFSQAEEGPQAGGLGIGLRVVKDLVALHGGLVQVISDGIGKGSEFIVRLPLLRGPKQPPVGRAKGTSDEARSSRTESV